MTERNPRQMALSSVYENQTRIAFDNFTAVTNEIIDAGDANRFVLMVHVGIIHRNEPVFFGKHWKMGPDNIQPVYSQMFGGAVVRELPMSGRIEELQQLVRPNQRHEFAVWHLDAQGQRWEVRFPMANLIAIAVTRGGQDEFYPCNPPIFPMMDSVRGVLRAPADVYNDLTFRHHVH